MKKLTLITGMLAVGALALAARPREAPAEDHPEVVLGTYDSRAVAIAYVRSDAHEAYLKGLHAELKQAKESGDADRVAELEALGPRLQRKAHMQGFGDAPVDDILEKVEDRLADVAAETGVDVLVSKWELDYRADTAQTVDVTDEMAALFSPDEETKKVIRDIVARDPMPRDVLEKHED
jgi:hypothetical protein